MSMEFDTSTIDMDALATLPKLSLPPSYHLQNHPGNGCFGDAPGYPTYFTRSVYTRIGNEPRRGATQALLGHVTETADWHDGDTYDKRRERYEALMRRLYLPLPYDHPRVEAWERTLYSHMQHCYEDTDGLFPQEYGRPALVIYPVPYYKLRAFRDDPRFSDEWREKERAAIAQANQETEARHAAAAQPERHAAVLRIRSVYPDAPIRADWIASPASQGNWYERYATRPSPEDCPGDRSVRLSHNTTGRCQFCGYTGGK